MVARKAVDPLLQSLKGSTARNIVRTCYACLGLAVAYWIFRRSTVKDPVDRLRTSGAL